MAQEERQQMKAYQRFSRTSNKSLQAKKKDTPKGVLFDVKRALYGM
jgi:hypothetical protein